jgi:hypothetical protein
MFSGCGGGRSPYGVRGVQARTGRIAPALLYFQALRMREAARDPAMAAIR